MNLDEEIIIQPPPFTDHNNKLIEPKPLVFKTLNVTYSDNPSSKTVFAQIQSIPNRILLISPEEYDRIGDYTQQQIETILKSKLGDNISVSLRKLFPPTLEEHPNGPGSILAGMFSTLGIKSSPTCSCKRHAIEMNAKGNQWCEDNLSTILSWLKEESTKRKIPFIESLASLVVKRAIRRSKQLGYEVTVT
jgi:hypothetical protein